MCLACGIYQAYVSFALVLTVVYFIGEMLEGRRTNGEAWLYIGRQAAIYAVGMILYYVVWRICLTAEDAKAVTYLGIDAAALYARWLRPWMGNIFAVVLALIILNNGVLANISYFYMHSSYERSYATALEMTTRMHMIADDDEIERIAIVGAGDKSDAVILGYDEPSSHAHILTGRLRSDLMYDREHIYHFLEGVLGVDFRFASNEECAELAEQPDVADMGVWPAKDSMRLRNGVLIIKIGQY